MKGTVHWLFISCLLFVAGPAEALSRALSLTELVQGSSFIARIRVLGVRLTRGEHPVYGSVASVEVLEVLRGVPGSGVIQVRFDNGADCPNVHFEEGERCLLFAERDIDGTYLPVGCDSGKKAVREEGYVELSLEIRRLSDRLRHVVSLRAVPGKDGDTRLQMRITNTGVEPLAFPNDVRVELREQSGSRRLLEELCERPTLILQLEDLQPRLLYAERGLEIYRPFMLEPNDTTEALIQLKDRVPGASGRQKLRTWFKVRGQLSAPVSLETDLEEMNVKALEKLKVAGPGEKQGPFQLTWTSRASRLIRRSLPSILVLSVAASSVLLPLALSLRRRGRRAPGAAAP